MTWPPGTGAANAQRALRRLVGAARMGAWVARTYGRQAGGMSAPCTLESVAARDL